MECDVDACVAVERATRQLQITHLLHDSSLALGKGDVTTRLVLDELDFDLAALTAGFVVVVIIVVGSGAGALTLDAATLDVAVLEVVVFVVLVGRILVNDLGGHGEVQ